MKDNNIPMTEANIEILQKMSSEFHNLYAEVMEKFGEKELKLIDDVLNFVYKIIQVIGLVAGFGFTGLGLVKQINLFIFGELFLLGSIGYGIYKIKKIYTSNLNAIQKSRNEISETFQEKSQIFQEVIPNALKEREMDMVNFRDRINTVDTKILKLFSKRENKSTKNEEQFLDVLILLLAIGAGLLLISFLP